MDSNKLPENTATDNKIATLSPSTPPRNDKGGLTAIWQWLMESNTRVMGVFMLGLALVLLLGLVVIVTSQKSTKKKAEATIPQASPTTSQPAQISQIPAPSLTPNLTKDWQSIQNSNGFKFKYPPKSKILPSLSEATSSSRIQVIATDSATLAVEVLDKNNPSVKDKPLLDIVNLIRDTNKDQQILTKPISILIAGYEGYEWYFTGDKFITITQTLSVKDAKNRVIQFDKNNMHYIILSTFDDMGEQLLSTLNIAK